MGTVIVFEAPRTVAIETVDDAALAQGDVRLRTLYSGISAGTELTAYRGSNPYLHKRWDPTRKLFLGDEGPHLEYPLKAWGYEEVGEIVELGAGVSGVRVGDLVYGTWGHRSHHVVSQEYARSRRMPEDLDPILGIFSQIGAIALNGIHDSRIRVGETVAVFGLGVPGQIAAQLAALAGATVIGIDPIPERLAIAEASGAIHASLDASAGAVAERIRDLTDGRGADVAVEVSGSTEALHEAIRSVAYSARVVALGFFQGNATRLFLGEEFHHNRVSVVGSQIYGVDPELAYRWNQLRLAQTVVRLQAERRLRLKELITHEFPYTDAGEAFRLVDERPRDALQVVLDFTREA